MCPWGNFGEPLLFKTIRTIQMKTDDWMMATAVDEVGRDGVQTEINMRWKKIKKEGGLKINPFLRGKGEGVAMK